MAPSPTGLLHIGNVRTALFNWLFARHEGGEFRLRIENTDTAREVYEATEQIQESLRWLGLDWDGEVTFQLDRMDDTRAVAEKLVADGAAYEDEGAIRFRMPDEGITAFDDVVLGRVEVPNAELEDLVLVRSDGRPTYNFASPLEDMWDGITHVIRGPDHISNTPKQINLLRAVGAELPVYAHVPNVNGADGAKLSKRHGAVSVDDFRQAGYLPEALMNFLALLGWAPDGETTIMSRRRARRALLARTRRLQPGDFRLREARLDERGLPARAAAGGVRGAPRRAICGSRESTGRRRACARRRRSCRRRSAGSASFPTSPVSSSRTSSPTPSCSMSACSAPPRRRSSESSRGLPKPSRPALKALCEELGEKPRTVYLPIRVAVTGSRVSPGLYESLELLGKEKSLARIRSAASVAA